MRTLDPFAWRTQDVTVYTRIGPEDAPHQVLARWPCTPRRWSSTSLM